MRYDSIVEEWELGRRNIFEQFLRYAKAENFDNISFPENENMPPVSELDDACKLCIFEQVRKYKDHLDDETTGQIGNKFLVRCSGIPKNYINENVFEFLKVTDEKEQLNMLASRDPVAWAQLNTYTEQGEPWIAREHQRTMLRCSSNRVVFRSGRRVGKSDALIIKVLFHSIVLPDRPNVFLDGKMIKQPLTTLIIAPRQTHADNLWRKLEAQLQHSPVIRDSVLEYKRYPYIDIRFKNGSKIFIMTAGTGGANAGLSIRSFSADLLCLDEGNYLGPEELKAALAILMTNENCKLIVSSTPVGMQDFFYDWCFHAPGFKEFHFPTPVLEHWNRVKKSVYQDVQSFDDFLHEYMAEFSPPGQSVFRIDLIQKAIKNYEYENMQYNPGFKYSIGIDWNSTAGTEIIVTGYDPENKHYLVVDNINIGKSEWTQLRSCDAVIAAVLKWRPFVIIADEGYGATQIEVLRAYAMRSNDSDIQSIVEILISYNFSSKIEVYDPVTKQQVKKSAKPFLVKNAVARFEEENIWISINDRLLIEQLSLYQIKSTSNLGLPTYWVPQEDIGDHRLDALMLSIMGFKMKQSFLFDNGGSVSEIGYISPMNTSGFSKDQKKQIENDGFQSLYISNRGGTIMEKLNKRVGRVNVN